MDLSNLHANPEVILKALRRLKRDEWYNSYNGKLFWFDVKNKLFQVYIE